jgi:hypothetical protein
MSSSCTASFGTQLIDSPSGLLSRHLWTWKDCVDWWDCLPVACYPEASQRLLGWNETGQPGGCSRHWSNESVEYDRNLKHGTTHRCRPTQFGQLLTLCSQIRKQTGLIRVTVHTYTYTTSVTGKCQEKAGPTFCYNLPSLPARSKSAQLQLSSLYWPVYSMRVLENYIYIGSLTCRI